MINNIVKLWYKIPRYKLKISLRKERVDDRSFEWYLDRKKYGFDERELWNLSWDLQLKIEQALNLPKDNEHISFNQFSMWFLSQKSNNDIKWFYDRVYRYVEWKCPYSTYIEDGKFVSRPEIDDILKKYVRILSSRIRNMILSFDEMEFLYKYNKFGW